MSGDMAGERFLKFLPLHESAFKRQSKLEDVVQGWCPNREGKLWKIVK